MLPDPRTLAFLVTVVSGGLESAPEEPSPLQADAVDAAPAPVEAAPEPAAAEGAAGDEASPQAPSEEGPETAAPAEPAPAESTAAFPDTEADASAVDPEPLEPAAEEPRTWNDPAAATAAAAADPHASSRPPPEADLDNRPLEPAKGKDPKGFGMAMVGAITFSPESGHAWNSGVCPSATITVEGQTQSFAPTGCGATPAAGISAEGRFGYMWGLFGAELYGQIASDYVNARLSGVPAIPGVPDYATQMHLGRLGIGGGAQARFKTPPGPFRLSVGAGGGFLYRTVFSNVSSLDGSFEDYAAPILRADVGVVVVSALTIGFMGWIEFAETVTVTPDLSALGQGGQELATILGDTVAYRGTQGFIGLFGGFAFGK